MTVRQYNPSTNEVFGPIRTVLAATVLASTFGVHITFEDGAGDTWDREAKFELVGTSGAPDPIVVALHKLFGEALAEGATPDDIVQMLDGFLMASDLPSVLDA
jgi:hypothetical protein